MEKTQWSNVLPAWSGRGRLCVVAQGSPSAGTAEELAASLLAHLAGAPDRTSPAICHIARALTVTAVCRDWRETERLPERIAPAILQAAGLRPRFTGLVCLDLRRCLNAPPAKALDELLDFVTPLGEDAGLLFLCRGQAAVPLCAALATLVPVAEVLEREETYPTSQRLIGFARAEEMR